MVDHSSAEAEYTDLLISNWDRLKPVFYRSVETRAPLKSAKLQCILEGREWHNSNKINTKTAGRSKASLLLAYMAQKWDVATRVTDGAYKISRDGMERMESDLFGPADREI